MKINKLKVFFISIFIAILIPLAASKSPIITSSALMPTIEIYPPKTSPQNYTFNSYNHCGSVSDDKLLLTIEGKSLFVIYSNSDGTYLATFDKNMYKTQEIKILDSICLAGQQLNSKIFLIDNRLLFVLDLSFTLQDTVTLTSPYNTKIINNELYIFCHGEDITEQFDYGKIVSNPYTFIEKCGDYFLYQSNKDIVITYQGKKLLFETDKYLSAISFGGGIIFACQKGNNIIITSMTGLTISYTTIINSTADYINFSQIDNGLYVYVTNTQTDRYFVCNHGDIISCENFSTNRYISLNNNIYESNGYINITIKNENILINSDIYYSLHSINDNYIIFEHSSTFETYGKTDIYVTKLF